MSIFTMLRRKFFGLAILFSITLFPFLLALHLLNLGGYDLSIPLSYSVPGADEIWQLVATKTLLDTGWVLTNPYLGAPGVSDWHGNSGAQTSALHSVFMLALGVFSSDAVKVQQIYYLLNFSAISTITYLVSRTLGVSVLYAILIAFLMSFTKFRVSSVDFAYLSNYFSIPVGVLLAYWIAQGKFLPHPRSGVPRAKWWKGAVFWSVPFTILVATSDGYYAFFTLLLLGFALFLRVLHGDLTQPKTFLWPILLILTLITTALALSAPLTIYRANNPSIANQDSLKQPHDAEVYSPSLSLLLAPHPNHRIEFLSIVSDSLRETANFNRKFKYPAGAPVILGTLGSVLLVLFLIYIFSRIVRRRAIMPMESASGNPTVLDISAAFSLYILFFTISGGLGSLLAFIYPSIRAYDRFPTFLLFVLYLGTGWYLSQLQRSKTRSMSLLLSAAALIVTFVAVLDQVPFNPYGIADGRRADIADRFLAERAFVEKIEEKLPEGAMIYQYPHSQYLTNNKYYGWGSFGQLRLYLHSKKLRWSNGNAKGDATENWHEDMALLSLPSLLTELRAMNFRAIVIDGTVISPVEYEATIATLKRLTGSNPIQDNVAKLAFFDLGEPAYVISYNEEFPDVNEVRIFDSKKIDEQGISILLNAEALRRRIHQQKQTEQLLTKSTDPDIFEDYAKKTLGFGNRKIDPPSLFESEVKCDPMKESADQFGVSKLEVTFRNKTDFDWILDGNTEYPIRAKLLILIQGQDPQEQHIPLGINIPAGESHTFVFDLQAALLNRIRDRANVKIELMQDGNTWFSNAGGGSCEFTIN